MQDLGWLLTVLSAGDGLGFSQECGVAFGPFRNDGCGAVDAGGAVQLRGEEPGKADEVTHRVFVAAHSLATTSALRPSACSNPLVAWARFMASPSVCVRRSVPGSRVRGAFTNARRSDKCRLGTCRTCRTFGNFPLDVPGGYLRVSSI